MEPGETEFEWIEAPPVIAKPWPSLPKLVWQGAWLGMRGMARVAVPLSAAVAIFGLMPTALGLGAGRGLTFSKYPVWAVPVFFGLETLGAMLGAAFGLVVGLVRLVRPPKSRPASIPLREAGPPVEVSKAGPRPSRIPGLGAEGGSRHCCSWHWRGGVGPPSACRLTCGARRDHRGGRPRRPELADR